jgi:hypothetical protein
MSQGILSVAIFEPLLGEESNALSTMKEIMAALEQKGLSHDVLYRSRGSHHEYILFRNWISEDARRNAQEDPEIQRGWAKLAHQIRILKIYESLDEIAASRIEGHVHR